ncbi:MULTISPECIES: sugar O-acetyltransferase [unclassified Streptomyces]|uniref:sugar O-acetyltransferase n=1 Tax=unclassified Streptomyces TaxID=2593676 RepID=UPI002DD916A6|nr:MULTISPECIES: sugar O-acetyltransferase [unclassified Streptomyces]WSA90937.1 sugar O-acetyltransferase [Streptomyces sp. NBC_01795]WSS16456.1 sugar O-acetyltransferase [Streptomyces sp. NBC_01186]WSS45274.1 sugar O-acetyltransferase [Streptomyces sp. NBC_01187]
MGENKQRMLAGDWFIPDDEELARETVRRAELCAAYNAAATAPPAERRAILEQLIGDLGEDVRIRPPFSCDFGTYLTIGANTFINFGAVFLDSAPITIGRDVQIGPNVQLLTSTHEMDAERRRAGWEKAVPISVGDNVWLGGGVIVCPGVTIGANTVVGAGTVVTKDLPENVLAVGNPARVVRSL